jgi:hypothetical protein
LAGGRAWLAEAYDEAPGTILALVLPSAATHTDVLTNRLNVAERTQVEGAIMHRRAFVGVCLTLVLLVAVGMPAVASPATSAARKPKVTTIPVGLGPVRVATNPQTNTIYVTNNSDGTVSVINERRTRWWPRSPWA